MDTVKQIKNEKSHLIFNSHDQIHVPLHIKMKRKIQKFKINPELNLHTFKEIAL